MNKEYNPLDFENKPKVILHSMTENPLAVIANCYKMIEEEEPVKNLKEIPKDIINKHVANAKTTALQMPLELVHLYFQIYNVPRIFTHKLCEYKYLSVKQQSMRYVSKVWNSFKYALPKSIENNNRAVNIVKDFMNFTKDKYEMLFEIERESKVKECTVNFFPKYEELKDKKKECENLKKLMINTPIADLEEKATIFFIDLLNKMLNDKEINKDTHYQLERRFIELLKQSWSQIQDMREVLPRNILTWMNVWISFRALLQMAKDLGKDEYWIDFFEEIKKEIKLKKVKWFEVLINWISDAQSSSKNSVKTFEENVKVSEKPILVSPKFTFENKEVTSLEIQQISLMAAQYDMSIMDFIKNEFKNNSNKLESIWFNFKSENILESLSHQQIRHRIWQYFTIPEISKTQPINKPLKYYDFVERDVADFRGWIVTKKHKDIMNQIVQKAQDARIALVNLGISVEDASHILPILVTNDYTFSISMRTLMMIASERLNMQASFMWNWIMKQIKESISNISPEWKEVAAMLLPGWVLWGRNPFQAVFDRKEQYKPEEIFNLWDAYSRKNYLLFKKHYWHVFFDEFTKEDEKELNELSKD